MLDDATLDTHLDIRGAVRGVAGARRGGTKYCILGGWGGGGCVH